jgi:hypothetical protein
MSAPNNHPQNRSNQERSIKLILTLPKELDYASEEELELVVKHEHTEQKSMFVRFATDHRLITLVIIVLGGLIVAFLKPIFGLVA